MVGASSVEQLTRTWSVSVIRQKKQRHMTPATDSDDTRPLTNIFTFIVDRDAKYFNERVCMSVGIAYLNKCSAVAEMGDR